MPSDNDAEIVWYSNFFGGDQKNFEGVRAKNYRIRWIVIV